MNSADDCRKAEGDGKSITASSALCGGKPCLNDWIFDGMSGAGVTLACTQTSQPSQLCEFTPGTPEPFVCNDAKPIHSLTMQWQPGSMTDSTRWVLTNPNQVIDIRAYNGSPSAALVATQTNIKPGDIITVTGFSGSVNDVYWEIFKANTNFADKLGVSAFHLSCSDENMNGSEDCDKYEGDLKVTSGYTGKINDWVFKGLAGDSAALNCMNLDPATAGTDVNYTYTITNTGASTITITSAFDDKLLEDVLVAGGYTLPYDLAAGASVKVTIPAFVSPDNTNVVTNTVKVTTTNAGCEATAQATVKRVPPPPLDINVFGAAAPTVDKNKFYWSLKNSGTDAAIITKVEVTLWPSQQGKLKKIKLDGDTAADPADIPWPGPAIITVFASDVNKKQIAAGQTRTFTIEFEKDYTLDTIYNYKFTITFEGGETLSWNVP